MRVTLADPPACSFCGHDGPVMSGPRLTESCAIAICRVCAELAADVMGEDWRRTLLDIAVRIVRTRDTRGPLGRFMWPPIGSGRGCLTPGYMRRVRNEFARLTGTKAAA